jgi:hypothetical protein
VEVETARRTNVEIALEVLFLHRVAACVALEEEPFAKGFLLRGINSGFGLGELRHGQWLA